MWSVNVWSVWSVGVNVWSVGGMCAECVELWVWMCVECECEESGSVCGVGGVCGV